MTATPYRAISWQPHEVLGDDKMNQVANNQQWLFENTPRTIYTFRSLTRSEGIKIVSGKAKFTRRKADRATVEVNFGNVFSRGCYPNITTGVNSDDILNIFVAYSGIGKLHPDHRGFRIRVGIAADLKKNDKISSHIWVAWQAMGY